MSVARCSRRASDLPIGVPLAVKLRPGLEPPDRSGERIERADQCPSLHQSLLRSRTGVARWTPLRLGGAGSTWWFVRIEVGPISSASARAWIEYATNMLAFLRTLSEHEIPSRAVDAFASLLDEWRPLAQGDKPFRWVTDETPERAKYLINALYLAGTLIEREVTAGQAHFRPAAADEFHVVIVHDVLRALEQESRADAQFVYQMRNVWDIARRD